MDEVLNEKVSDLFLIAVALAFADTLEDPLADLGFWVYEKRRDDWQHPRQIKTIDLIMQDYLTELTHINRIAML